LIDQLNILWQFHDTKLSSTVDGSPSAGHRRTPPTITPAVWDPPATGQVPRRQVWFPGVHSDVGGGYEDRQLADITLRWMVEGAETAGLAFQPGTPGATTASAVSTSGGPSGTGTVTRTSVPVQARAAAAHDASTTVGATSPVVCDPIHDSMTLFYRLLIPLSRPIGRVGPDTEAAASNAVTRLNTPDCRYSPDNLRTYFARDRHRVETV
jgi:hypothetical protein